MTEQNSIEAIEKQIADKSKALLKLRKDIPKMIILVIAVMFVLPYFPMRKGSLISQYGYVNALLFEAAVFIIAIPLVTVFTLRKMEQEIYQLERDLEIKKRLEKINEKEV
jgi:membrane protein YdbS with pleckstrin-like domain